VIEEDLDPILIQVTVPLPMSMIFSGFADAHHLQGWMCDEAFVDPKLGGRYEVGWSDPPFRSNGKVTQITPDVDIGFSWLAPVQFDALMNQPEPKTNVYIRLQESPEGIDVTLEHSGWGRGTDWEEARSWHFHLWDDRLHRLRDYLLKVAYG
jgi:uncharacterized protein YndB with AHSA1/START domain